MHSKLVTHSEVRLEASFLKKTRKNWEDSLAHNEKYALGEIYYPITSWTIWHETEAETAERYKKPIVCDF